MTSSAAPPPKFSWQLAASNPAPKQPKRKQKQKQKQPASKRKAAAAAATAQPEPGERAKKKPKASQPAPAAADAAGAGAGAKAAPAAAKAAPAAPAAAAAAAAAADDEPTFGSSGWRVFVGQLPFYLDCDKPIRKHFAQAGCDVAGIRMLSDKKTSKFRGVAFVELADKESLTIALSLHQSRLGHKKINVELSAGGGGNGAVRKEKIKVKRDRLNKQAEAAAERKGNKARDSNSVPVGKRSDTSE